MLPVAFDAAAAKLRFHGAVLDHVVEDLGQAHSFRALQCGIAFHEGDLDDVGYQGSDAVDIAFDAIQRGPGVG